MDKEIQRQLATRLVIQRRVIPGDRANALPPDNAFLSDCRRRKATAWLREKNFRVIVKAQGDETVQRLAAKYDPLKSCANTFYPQNDQLAKTQLITNTLWVAYG